MTRWTRFVLAGAGLWAALAVADAALAQDNFDAGKTGAQLFASDCAICHKSPQSIGRDVGGPFGGLESFLREHYTASREAAASITAYLNSVGAPATAEWRPARSRRKAEDKAKKDAKPAKSEQMKEKKPEEKSGDKPAEKPADKKSDKDKKDSGQATHAKSAAMATAATRG